MKAYGGPTPRKGKKARRVRGTPPSMRAKNDGGRCFATAALHFALASHLASMV